MFLVQRNNRYLALVILIQYVRIVKIFSKKALFFRNFLTYPFGLWNNPPIHSQTISVAPGDASIVKAKGEYPGNYFFHTHGIQEEKGNMGQIKVVGKDNGITEAKSKFMNYRLPLAYLFQLNLDTS